LNKELVVDVRTDRTRVAVLENQELVEFYIERTSDEKLVGNIYRGKVYNVLPGMQAAFVDIGYEKNAYLYVDDAQTYGKYSIPSEQNGASEYKIEDIVKVGQEITVQVIKEAFGTKGPRVTTNITMPGKNLVFLPKSKYIGVSKKITSTKERERLRDIAGNLELNGSGVIIRTEAIGEEKEEIERELEYLKKQWGKIYNKERKGNVPRCLHIEIDLLNRVVRELFTKDVNSVIINDQNAYDRVIELSEMFSPSLKFKVEHFTKSYDIYEFYQIHTQINKALSRHIWLKSGGVIFFDKTEALTAIDVNTGKYTGKKDLEETIFKTNVEAVKEIAKQIRLRNIGGIIIIDFIDMNDEEHQQQIINILKEELKKDHTKTSVLGMTGLGLVEMTRKKESYTLESLMTVRCPHCNGSGKIFASV